MTKLAQVLFQRLEKEGVDCTFGIPGDFVLPLYAAQEEYGMKSIVCTHEPSAAFAADAYARLKGLGVALTTFGPGGLNMVNPVAMAYAEHSPVLVISGAPDLKGRIPGYYPHHLVKDFDSQLNVFREITAAAITLDNPETAVNDIEWLIQTIIQLKRPGYLEIPRDMINSPVRVPIDFPRTLSLKFEFNQDTLYEAALEIVNLLTTAVSPVIYAGVGVRRNNLAPQVIRLSEQWGIPVVSSVLGKASFPETHSQYRGVYMGELGDPLARDIMENADCVLSIGVIHSDVNTGFLTGEIKRHRHIAIHEFVTEVFHHKYENLPMEAMVTALAERPLLARKVFPAKMEIAKELEETKSGKPDEPLKMIEIIYALKELDAPKYSVLADIGEAWFIGLGLRTDIFMAPGYYSSMGFAAPAGLGAGMARKDLRPLIIVGDGAFQMTGVEIATIQQQGIRAIVLVLNNSGYNMLRALDDFKPYYDIPSWDYTALAKSLHCEGEKVTTLPELQQALEHAEHASGLYLIEALMDPNDHAPIMAKIQTLFAKKRNVYDGNN